MRAKPPLGWLHSLKTLQLSPALCALIVLPGVAAAASNPLTASVSKVLPVLVQVDSHGKVTSVSPATVLPPRLNQLLSANLDEMISSPAIDKTGAATYSRFVINLALHTWSRTDVEYDVKFSYVSTAPVPAGSWYWVHTDGRELALASQSACNWREYLLNRDGYRNVLQGQGRPAVPTIRNPATPAATTPVSARATDPGIDP